MANLRRQPAVFAGGTSRTDSTPYPHTPGDRGWDGSGNEYIYCAYTGTIHDGCLSVISRDGAFTIAPYAVGAYGNVGVVIAGGSSDHAGWVQIGGYTAGYVQAAGGSSLGTSSGRALVATSLSSPATGLLTVSTGTSLDSDQIYGMWLTQLTSTGTTSVDSTNTATSFVNRTGLRTRVFMDHPYIRQPDSTS